MKNKTTFVQFRDAIQKSFNNLAKSGNLFQSQVDKDAQWELYLSSYPEGTNPLFRERTTHDCQCCKRFIRNVGRVLGEVDGKLVSVFDNLAITGEYKVVAEALAKFNRESGIGGIYLNDEQVVGQRESFEEREAGVVHTWEHFHQVLPFKAYSLTGDIGSRKGKVQTNSKVLKRSITELTQDSVAITLELIEQNSLHRGGEFIAIVKGLKKLQDEYKTTSDKDLYLWNKTVDMLDKGFDCNIRGTAIGTLLVDLSKDVELEVAVKKYEDKVSGTNYKRTSALVTPRMKEEAKLKAKELGVEPSLPRRTANKSDISVNDVLYADNTVKPFMEDSLFDMVSTKATPIKNLDKVETVTSEDFINKILPKAESVEVFLENKHESNLMSLIAPVNPTSPCIMKWGNNFSWNYNGEVAESVTKQQVKAAGGITDAPLRVSMSWKNRDDLDLHLVDSRKGHVYYGTKSGNDGSRLDVDMRGEQSHQVENIYWTSLDKLRNGTRIPVAVHNYSGNGTRNGDPVREEGCIIEIEHNGEISTFEYTKRIPSGAKVQFADIVIDSQGGITVEGKVSGTSSMNSKNIWGIETGQFHKVDMVMRSPNYWDNSNKTGNEHLFFILDKCVNPDDSRGFYNEFLTQELQPHRKVFEVLASQLKAEYSEDQLSGVGFSSTLRNEVTLRVKGSFNRTIKVKF
ncbi:putative YfaP [Vibrio phage 193E37-1]|nr:putative YfaP [Vibrio phage 193E37-1]